MPRYTRIGELRCSVRMNAEMDDGSREPAADRPSASGPTEVGHHEGLAYALWLPPDRATIRGGVVILHGGGACKERHFAYAERAYAAGFGAISFDLRGHGESVGPMGGEGIDDVVMMTGLLRERIGRPDAGIALRGSSMGGYFALISANAADALAVVAICPAPAVALRRFLAAGRLPFDHDPEALNAFLTAHTLREIVSEIEAPVLIQHAEGDDVIPIRSSRVLSRLMGNPDSRFTVAPRGGHGSVQHDALYQAESLRFIEQFL